MSAPSKLLTPAGRAAEAPADPRVARRAPPALRPFNDLAVLSAADVHVARRLADLGADGDDAVLLGAALAVRGLRLGHVCVDLAAVRRTVTTDVDTAVDLSLLPWPDPTVWRSRLAASPLVADGDQGAPGRPLRLVANRLYLDRYWRQERQVAADLRARRAHGVDGVDSDALREGIDRLFRPDHAGSNPGGPHPDLQRLAAAAAVMQAFAVIAGGPGTGKTTTVARVLALLEEQTVATGGTSARVALAAPTGKAASRLEEAVHAEAERLSVAPAVRTRLLGMNASTIHRLLGWRPDSQSRFAHDRNNHLPHEVVIVDETSMVSLALMSQLVEAVRPEARLILVGDPEQLASVEAGAVLGDIVGPADNGLLISPEARQTLGRLTGQSVPAADAPGPSSVGDGIIVLRRVHRFGGNIARLAEAIQGGHADAAISLLRGVTPEAGDSSPGAGATPDSSDLEWIHPGLGDPWSAPSAAALAPVRHRVVEAGRLVWEAAGAGDGARALRQLASVRVLCAHRRGPFGVASWTARIEDWLTAAVDGYDPTATWYVGRPLLVTANDPELQLYNGDTGVVVDDAGGEPTAVFERRGVPTRISPSRLGDVETLHALTVHKSQGSQFDSVVVVLPEASSPVLTRELLYTAVTRARRRVTVVGPEESLRAAISRPIARASGLRERLWA